MTGWGETSPTLNLCGCMSMGRCQDLIPVQGVQLGKSQSLGSIDLTQYLNMYLI